MSCDTTDSELTTLLPNQRLPTQLQLTQETNCVHPVVQTANVDSSQTPHSSSPIKTNHQLNYLEFSCSPPWPAVLFLIEAWSKHAHLLFLQPWPPLSSLQQPERWLKNGNYSGPPWPLVVDSMLPLQRAHVWLLVRERRPCMLRPSLKRLLC